MAHPAPVDTLSGTFSRHAVLTALDDAVRTDRRSGLATAAVYFDLDGLKLINDHDAGDRMIYDFAGAALYHVRSTDRLGRMGGDEFLLVCPNSTMVERSLAWLAHRAAAVNLGLTHHDGRQLATR